MNNALDVRAIGFWLESPILTVNGRGPGKILMHVVHRSCGNPDIGIILQREIGQGKLRNPL